MMRDLYWIMEKPGQNLSVWGNKNFDTEQEAVEYLRANIAYPTSDTKFSLVKTVSTYNTKFTIEKR